MSWILRPKWLIFVLLCATAGVLAVLRAVQMTTTRPATEIHFTELHSLNWSPSNGVLEPAGEDPHAFIEIPESSVPLVGLVMEFSGPLPPGNSFIYPSPAHYPGVQLSDQTVVTGRVEPTAEGFRLHFETPPSRVARFDLPDALRDHFVLRSVTYRTSFIGTSNAVFCLFAAAVTGALGILFWTWAGPTLLRWRYAEIACITALIGVKLWVAGDLELTIFPDAMHDDALFMKQGHSIANGDWLGEFNELTLSKGPTFQGFIALVQLTRIPFLMAETGLHAFACVLFLIALWPVLKTSGLRISLFAILLFDPHTLSIQVVAQVLRSGIQPALTLLTLAGFLGVLVRLPDRQSTLRLLPWSALAGVCLPLFWFCREEGIWLVPSVALLVGSMLIVVWRQGVAARWRRIAVVLLPIAMFYAAQSGLRALNHHYYGESITIDVKDGGYPEAYAALTRITPKERIPGVPMTKESRLRAYEVSPAFADLKPSLEGGPGDNWAQNGWEGIDHPSARKEIRGWFQWALRQAAREAGHYKNAATASAYWYRVAAEINAACDSGRIAAGPRRSGFTPQMDASLAPALLESFGKAIGVVVQFSDFNPESTVSAGTPSGIAFYSRMLHEPAKMARTPPTLRTHMRVGIYHIYAALGGLLSVLSLLSVVALALVAWKTRSDLVRVAVLLALAGGAFALIAIIALVDATSFSTTHGIYLAPATPLALALWAIPNRWAYDRWRSRLPTIAEVADRLPVFWRSPFRRRYLNLLTAAAAFAIGALIAGLVRFQQTHTALPGHAVIFPMVNDLRWDAATQVLSRTGGDPFAVLELPATSVPVNHVAADFDGEFVEVQGNFYVFQFPADLPGNGIDGDTLSHGKITRRPGGFTVDWELQDSKAVRIDLPDYLAHSLKLRELRIGSTFAWLGSKPFRICLLCSLGAVLCLVAWRSVGRGPHLPRGRWFEVSIVVVLMAAKLGLASDVPFTVFGSAAHDDALYVGQADSVMQGKWLGAFNQVTLAKGPVYSLFLAGVGISGVRLELVQTLFHAVACAAFMFALRPLIASRAARLLLFAVLLLDPHTFSSEVVGRPLRSGIQPALTLFALAGFAGLVTRLESRPLKTWLWAGFAGTALTAFWYCREEGVWLAPSLVLMVAFGLVLIVRGEPRARVLRAGVLLAPLAIWYGATWTLRLINWHVYDAAMTMDVKDGNFPRAYGALTRITPATVIPLVPVTKETRLRAYAFSPAFKELEPLLEGALGDGWSQPGWEGVDHPSARKEMRGWFQWAIREAAAQAGHYKSAATANAYWGRVADEINAACDRGDLPAGPKRAGFFPRWDPSRWPDLMNSLDVAYAIAARFAGFGLHLSRSDATPEQYALFRRVTHEEPSNGKPAPSFRQRMRLHLYNLYNSMGAWLTPFAAVATAVLTGQAIRFKRGGLKVTLLLALLGGALALITLVSLVNALAFPAINGSYLSPASPLLLAAWVLAPLWAWQASSAAVRDAFAVRE